MSVETPMSVITRSAVAPAMGATGKVSFLDSIGPKIGSVPVNTGVYKLESSNIFSETFALPMPSFKFPEGGKNIPDISPFNNTQTLWQAPQTLNPELAPLVSAPDAIRRPTHADLNSASADVWQSVNKITREVIAKMDLATMPRTTAQREIIADVEQAIRVQDALIAMGSTRTEARKIAYKVFNETETKKGMSLALQKESAQKLSEENEIKPETSLKKPEERIPVRDDVVNAKRVSMAMEIATQVVRESNEGGKEPTGNDLFIKIPADPQKELVSGIAEGGRDGSYYGFREDLKKIEKINPYKILPEIQNAVENNSAVENGQDLRRKATQDEVYKVWNGRQVAVFHI